MLVRISRRGSETLRISRRDGPGAKNSLALLLLLLLDYRCFDARQRVRHVLDVSLHAGITAGVPVSSTGNAFVRSWVVVV